MLFRDAMATALKGESQGFAEVMLANLGVERKALLDFIAGKPTLSCSEVELVLKYLGFRLEKQRLDGVRVSIAQ